MASGGTPVTQQAAQAAHELAKISDKEPLAGFKQFISRGSMVDMAVGVVMGSAVTAVVNSIVKNLLSPLIAMIFGKPDLSGLLTISNGKATISFGAIIGDILNFILVAAAIYFCIILPMNKLRDLTRLASSSGNDQKTKDDTPSPDQQTVQLLQSILDQMKAAGGTEATTKSTDKA
ncbi:large conductance mechanosensitive channel protein MscL [Bifidobacterium xylocopae]|uniref:Large-conductance mechanosensitive channel n=1 Tax=Bifidobacterium xylocopae TaxID=2493119 RepID=A0A366KDA9_9BIFI|nr:large conductance mechanosensitive channel protein MscL [Bifidobacterium xylocopae]RBP99367.1 large conductance mechanosensitive channel protein MscL [Bifidobacterium xylocopae]